jgi:hypothetical protein
MAIHVWTILCRRAIVNKDDNLLSLIDLFEGFAVPSPPPPPADRPKSLPAVSIGICIASLWRRNNPHRPERAIARCKVLAPDGKTVTDTQLDLVFEDPFINMRSFMQLPFLPLRGPGTYEFVMYVGDGKTWKKVTAVPVPIQYLEPPAVELALGKEAARKAPRRKRKAY